jgi:hypothetical protein
MLLGMSPFHRSQDSSPQPPDGLTEVENALQHFSELSLAQRATEILKTIAPDLDDQIVNPLRLPQLLSHWLPDRDETMMTDKWSWDQRGRWFELEVLLSEAVQALVLARMLVRLERWSSPKGTTVCYANSPDGSAALERGDSADVIARRLHE